MTTHQLADKKGMNGQILLIWIVMLMLCLTNRSWSQQMPFALLSIADGLEDMVIFDIEQDDTGFLWITTRTGINRFDGNQFWTYTRKDGLPHNLVRDLLKADDGTLWAASEAGLARFNGHAFEQVLTDEWADNASSRAIRQAPDGSLWLATYGMGLLQIDISGSPKIIRQFNQQNQFPTNKLRSLFISDDGTVWAGDSAQVYRITQQDNQAVSWQVVDWQAEPSEIRTFFRHPSGDLWVGTRQGIAWLDGDAFKPKTLSADLSQLAINAISLDRQGQVWVSTRDNGAYQFDQQDQLLKHFNMSNGLPDNSVNQIYQDNELNTWFGTYGGGIARLSTTDVLNWKAQPNMPNPNVYAITEDPEGCMWFGTNGDGVSKLCGDQLTHITKADGLSHNKVLTSLIDDQGDPWFGTLQGISHLRDGSFIQLHSADGLMASVIYHMTKARDGSFWLATNNGLSHYRDGSFKTYYSSDGLPDNRINRVFESQDGSIWLGTSNGLSRWDHQRFTNWSVSDGLAANFINDIYEDDQGLLWLATNNGLSVFDGQEFRTWTTDEGLPHNNVTTLLQGQAGDIWIGTSRGVAIFDGVNFTIITSREGLVFDLVNRSAGYRDARGNLWFGTGAGISRFSASFKPGAATPPPVHLLQVSNELGQLPTAIEPAIKQQDSNLTFSYTAISFQRAPDVNYRYRLDSGANTSWRETRLNQIQINSLAPGKYRFEVSARIGNGAWNDQPAHFEFTVTPPFWRTTGFMLMTLLAVLLAFFYRGYRSRKRAHFLEQIVQERTRQLEEVNQGLDWLANHDNLTGLSNRHHMQQIIQDFAGNKNAEPMGVIIIDLDHFKKINDQFGHALGDQALIKFSRLLKDLVDKRHTTARWGGEEFVVLCPATSLQDTQQLVIQILKHCQQLNLLTEEQHKVAIRCSLGFIHCADLPPPDEVPNFIEKSIQLADQALYEAKQQGRNQAQGYLMTQPHQQRSINRYLLDTQQALANGQLQQLALSADGPMDAKQASTHQPPV
jgi:diguanylate cyclase (GGDEF)-like protein